MRALLGLVVACGACGRSEVASCDDPLGGIYRHGGERWIVVDHGASLEVFPLFPDVPAVAGTEVAPRVFDLDRTTDGVAGSVKRRYMRGSKACVGRVPVKLTACRADGLDVVLADPVPPLTIEPCAYPRHDANRRERWLRE